MTQYMQEAGAMKQAPVKLQAVAAALNMCRESNSEVRLPTPMCWDLALYVTQLEAALATAKPEADKLTVVLPRYIGNVKSGRLVDGISALLSDLGLTVKNIELKMPDEGTLTAGKQGGDGVRASVPTSLTDAQIDAIWDSVPPQGDPTGHKFARAFARAVLGACPGPNSGCVADCETHPACMFKATGGVKGTGGNDGR